MMEGIRTYLLQIISTALICGILVRLMGNKGLLTETVKLLAGVIMIITLLSPWVSIHFGSLEEITGDFSQNAESAVMEGKISAHEAISQIIKERSETYILDKACVLGVNLSVEVHLTNDTLPYPNGVTLSGPVSPYAKRVLADFISENLGISMEDQEWIA